jgi:hypothetical protein
MCWEGSTYLGVALVRTRASFSAAAATRQVKDDAEPSSSSDSRRATARWAVDSSSSHRAPRSSDDTKDSIAEWRAARVASLQRASEVAAAPRLSPSPSEHDGRECPVSACGAFNCPACGHACDFCSCAEGAETQRVALRQCSCVGCDNKHRPFTRRKGLAASTSSQRRLPESTRALAEYPPHPDDVSLTASVIWFFDAAWDAVRGVAGQDAATVHPARLGAGLRRPQQLLCNSSR